MATPWRMISSSHYEWAVAELRRAPRQGWRADRRRNRARKLLTAELPHIETMSYLDRAAVNRSFSKIDRRRRAAMSALMIAVIIRMLIRRKT